LDYFISRCSFDTLQAYHVRVKAKVDGISKNTDTLSIQVIKIALPTANPETDKPLWYVCLSIKIKRISKLTIPFSQKEMVSRSTCWLSSSCKIPRGLMEKTIGDINV